MPDTSSVRTQINSYFTTNGSGNISGSMAKTVLLALCDLVDGIFTTFLKVGTGTTSTSNGDDVYHTGKMIVGRTTDDATGNKLQVAGGVNADLVSTGGLQVYAGIFNSISSGNTDGSFPAVTNSPGSAKLAIGANNIPGYSDVSLYNANVAGVGFSFWQMLTSSSKKLLMVMRNGNVGIGTINPTAALHLKTVDYAANQFRIEDTYTPANTGEQTGIVGNIIWDTNYIYVRTSAGWKRSALSTF